VRASVRSAMDQAYSGDVVQTGPAVRSASLLEQRGFELPVLFVVPGAYERLEVSARATALRPTRELFSERSTGNSGRKRHDFGLSSRGKKTKEDRRFESPLLHRRVSANRRSRSLFLW